MDKRKKILDALSKSYTDLEVKKYQELADKLFEYAQEVDSGKNLGNTCVGISTLISRYIFKYKLDVPKSLVELQNLASKEAQVYKGWSSIGIWS